LGATPMVRHIKYYKGEGGGFPQVDIDVVIVVNKLFSPICRLYS
jgi:hypothetical protein